jgi:hypothetical protein
VTSQNGLVKLEYTREELESLRTNLRHALAKEVDAQSMRHRELARSEVWMSAVRSELDAVERALEGSEEKEEVSASAPEQWRKRKREGEPPNHRVEAEKGGANLKYMGPRRMREVWWLDSCITQGEVAENEIEKAASMLTVGILVVEDDDTVTIARDVHEPPPGRTETWRDCIVIPRSAIISCRAVSIATPRNDRVVVGQDGEL